MLNTIRLQFGRFISDGEVLFIFADLRHDFCTVFSNEAFYSKFKKSCYLRHAKPESRKSLQEQYFQCPIDR
jgi:hypothetical protein